MLTGKKRNPSLSVLLLLLNVSIWCAVWADDQNQWGQRYSRNMVSSEKGLPDSFDPDSAKNIKWVAELGTQTYSTPVVAGGKVLIGTNNENPRDARHKGDRAVLMCFNETDGSFCWQLVVPKVGGDPHFDWPRVGIVSAPTVEGDRAYVVSNRGEVLCLDLNGQANGNDGPYQDEDKHMAPRDAEPMQVTKTDADIIWLFDMPAEIGIHLHDETHSSILLHGEFLYLNSCNGINSSHDKILAPDAPSLIVLDKNTGRLLAQDEERIGPRIFHCTWSSPALGEVNGRTLIFFCGGDGVCYAFEALQPAPAPEVVQKLKRVWRFDCDPTAPKEDVHKYIGNRNESPSNVKSMPVFHNNRVYVTYGGDIWWGKDQAWLTCIDATGTGDITRSGQLWSYPLNRHCCSTPSVYDGLVFVADCGRTIHCVDADTGQAYWTHDAKGEMWACTLAADGKVYVATRRGDLWVLAASKEKQVISSIELDSAAVGTPVAANGTIYITTMKKLYAVRQSVE